MVKTSIWKDTFFTDDVSKLTYKIELDGSVIFTGRAYGRPDEGSVRININKICENYLNQDIDRVLTGATSQTNTEALRTFTLKDEDDTTLETYMFLYDWSYATPWNGSSRTLSNPINGHYANGMLKLKTTVSSSAVTTYRSTGSYPTLVKCADYAVYYLNAAGGWDSFLFEGSVVRKDNITSHNSSKFADNTSKEFEVERYATEISTSYAAKTGWLNDDEAAKFAANLIGSTKVYLHNLKDGTIKPLVITDNTAEYQTFKTNGRKFCQYTLNMKESQTKYRR